MALGRNLALVATLGIANKAGAYAAGQQVGIPVEIKNAAEDSGACSTLQSFVVLDPAKQNQPLDVIFFSQKPASSGDGVAFNPSASDLANCLGSASILAANYSAFSANSVATAPNIRLKLKPSKASASQSNTSVWAVVVSRGTPAYGAANNLTIVLGLDKD
jgi:hypothetical protein